MPELHRVRIRMEAYDHEVLDQSATQIVNAVLRTGAKVSGPVPLPTRIERYTVLRSPHVDKKSQTTDALQRLSVPAGVGIKVKA